MTPSFKLVVLSLMVSTVALLNDKSRSEAQDNGEPRTPTRTIADVNFSDGQIMTIVKTIDQGEIDLGKYMESKAKNKEVVQFAQHMIKDHSQSKKAIEKLSDQMHLKTSASDQSQALEKATQNSMQILQEAKNERERDRMYVEDQVKMHQTALNLVDNSLTPSAKKDAVREELQKVHGLVQEHLAHAKALQFTIGQK